MALVGNDKVWNTVRAISLTGLQHRKPVPPLWQERCSYPALHYIDGAFVGHDEVWNIVRAISLY